MGPFKVMGLMVVLALVAWLYHGVVHFGYVWDDRAFFLTSTGLREGSLLAAITDPVLAGSAYFRPLVMAWFVAEIRLLGADPSYPHVANLLLHLGNTVLVGVLARRLCPGEASRGAPAFWRPLIAMTVYGLHPALTEPVAWISGRFDLAVAFFSLLAIVLATSSARRTAHWAGLAFFAAACSKEMAATVPALAWLVVWAVRHPNRSATAVFRLELGGPSRWLWLSLVAAGLLYMALRLPFVHSLTKVDPELLAQLDTPLRHAAFVGQTLLFYIQSMAWPFVGLGPLHPFDVWAMTGLQMAAGIGVLVVAAAVATWALLFPTAARLLFLCALVSLLPVLNIIPLNIIGNIGHERFLVLPLALAVLATVCVRVPQTGISSALRQRLPALGAGVAGLWCVVAALNVHVTLPLWSGDLALWQWAYRKNPDFAFAQFSLTAAALREQRFDVVKEVILDAEKRGPMPLRLSIPYGQYLIRTNQADVGIAKIEAALEHEPRPHLRVFEDGRSLDEATIKKGDFGGWLQIYAYSAIAEGHLSRRRFEQARQAAEIALFYQRDNPTARLLKSLSSYGLNHWTLAQQEFEAARLSYLPADRASIVAYRSTFLKQLCQYKEGLESVCEQFASERSAVSLPGQ